MIGQFKQLIEDGHKAFRLFTVGAVLCMLGLLLVVWANSQPDSVRREIVAATALFIAGLGFFTAIGAHICLLIYRLRQVGQHSRDNAHRPDDEFD